MARIEIRLTGTQGGGKRTEINVERLTEVDAVAQAIGLLLASYGSEIRAVLSRVGETIRIVEEMLPRARQSETTDG